MASSPSTPPRIPTTRLRDTGLGTVAGRIVACIRSLWPTIALTHDAVGQLTGHPGHQRTHEVTRAAVDFAIDTHAHPEAEAPWQVRALQATTRPHSGPPGPRPTPRRRGPRPPQPDDRPMALHACLHISTGVRHSSERTPTAYPRPVPRKAKRARRLIADGRVYLWSLRHSHNVTDSGRTCCETLTLYPQPSGTGGALRIIFDQGPGRYVPGGAPLGSGDVGYAMGPDLNLHEPGAVRALLDTALARGWQPEARLVVEIDGWSLLEAAAAARARATGSVGPKK